MSKLIVVGRAKGMVTLVQLPQISKIHVLILPAFVRACTCIDPIPEVSLTDSAIFRILRTFSMPNKHAAIKDLRKNKKRAARNSKMKTHLKALDRHWKAFLKEGKLDEAKVVMTNLQKALGKAAKNAVIHKNKASRRVSSMHRAISTASAKK